jgi:hypothetical protein
MLIVMPVNCYGANKVLPFSYLTEGKEDILGWVEKIYKGHIQVVWYFGLAGE